MPRSLTERLTQGAQRVASRVRSDAATVLSSLRSPIAPFSRDLSRYLPDDLVHRIVWVVPEDALADGWMIDTGEEQDILSGWDQSVGLRRALTEAAGLARLGDGELAGGAFLWLVWASDDDFRAPAPVGGEVVRVHALSCTELTALEWEGDPRSPRWGLPSMYRLRVARGGLVFAGHEIHASRLVYVPGIGRARRHGDQDSEAGRDWGAVKVYREAIQGLDQGWRSSARLLERRSIPALTLDDGPSLRSADSVDLADSLELFRESLTVDKLAVLIGGSSLDWKSPTVSGTAELITALAWRASVVEGIPLTRLLGQPPAGLSSDDAAAKRSYDALLNRYRTTVYEPALLQVYERAHGEGVRRVVWPALDEPSSQERAATSLALAQRDSALVTAGIILPEEARRRHDDGSERHELMLDDNAWAADMADLGDELGPDLGVDDGETAGE